MKQVNENNNNNQTNTRSDLVIGQRRKYIFPNLVSSPPTWLKFSISHIQHTSIPLRVLFIIINMYFSFLQTFASCLYQIKSFVSRLK